MACDESALTNRILVAPAGTEAEGTVRLTRREAKAGSGWAKRPGQGWAEGWEAVMEAEAEAVPEDSSQKDSSRDPPEAMEARRQGSGEETTQETVGAALR